MTYTRSNLERIAGGRATLYWKNYLWLANIVKANVNNHSTVKDLVPIYIPQKNYFENVLGENPKNFSEQFQAFSQFQNILTLRGLVLS